MVDLHPFVAQIKFFINDVSFLIERLMLPVEAPQAYSFAVSSRIVLYQHVDDHRLLGGISKEKCPAHAEARTRDSGTQELVCPITSD